jgi:hypothetical protein
MSTPVEIRAQDTLPVRSRVSWGAVLAGAVVAFAVCLLFGFLGTAVGLSVRPHVTGQELGTGTVIYSIVVTLVSLGIGGCVATRCAVGETRLEAVLYGVMVWCVLFAALFTFMASGAAVGFSSVMNVASVSRAPLAPPPVTEEALRAAGIVPTPEQAEKLRTMTGRPADSLQAMVSDPDTIKAAWWTFTGLLLSMGSAVLGAIAGSGPNFVVRRLAVRNTATILAERQG